jgi:polysaccharide deacetylase family protein (PEP-CTERM system associated)
MKIMMDRTDEHDEPCIFSVDVEDWFHILQIPGAPDLAEWDRLPSRVERDFLRLLDLFDETGTHVTCFFLCWVAERFPRLVREAVARGHEIASHGYAHRLVFEQSSNDFLGDIRRAKAILEDLAGESVKGYRSPGFSATSRTDWFFECLVEAGYEYDSSIFPAKRTHGGMLNARREPHLVTTQSGSILEFPVSVANLAGQPVCFFGGGYLRLFPYSWIRRAAEQVIAAGRPVIFYVHPREIDPDHPRLKMSLGRRFRSYVNLRSTEQKIVNIASEFPLTTFREFIERRAHRFLATASLNMEALS